MRLLRHARQSEHPRRGFECMVIEGPDEGLLDPCPLAHQNACISKLRLHWLLY